MTYSKIHLEIHGVAALITIDSPPVNALHPNVASEILSAIQSLAGVPEVRGVVITGRGRHFVAGGDITHFPNLNGREAETYALGIQRMQQELTNFDRPVIAAVNGTCLGGGCELMMACDIRIADQSAQFGQPEIRLGLMPGAGGTQNLPRLIGAGQAKRLLYTGAKIGSDRALNLGLVDEIVPDGRCVEAAVKLIEEISANAPLAVAQIKRAVNMGLDMALGDGLRLEAALFGELFRTEDVREGVSAFLGKRKPQFRGC